MRDHEQQRDASHALEQQIERVQGGGIGPMYVLEEHDAGPVSCGGFEHVDYDAQGLILELWGCQGHRAISPLDVNRQHSGDEARVFARAPVMTHHHRVELFELRLRRLAAAELQSALKIGDDWMESAVHMIRRALKSQDGRAVSLQSRAEFGQDAALADTWLARN